MDMISYLVQIKKKVEGRGERENLSINRWLLRSSSGITCCIDVSEKRSHDEMLI